MQSALHRGEGTNVMAGMLAETLFNERLQERACCLIMGHQQLN